MAPIIVPDPVEARDIHAAVCRARRATLACSLCTDLALRAAAAR